MGKHSKKIYFVVLFGFIAVGLIWLGMVNLRQRSLNRALIQAIVADHDAARVKSLLAQGADPNIRGMPSESAASHEFESLTVLMHAVATSNPTDIPIILLDSGAEVNLTDQNGWTALMYAAMSGSADSVQSLLQRGANVHAKSKDDLTALRLAKERTQRRDIIALLKQAGAKE